MSKLVGGWQARSLQPPNGQDSQDSQRNNCLPRKYGTRSPESQDYRRYAICSAGTFRGAFVCNIGTQSVFYAEVMAIIFAIEYAAHHGWRNIWLESDSTNALRIFSNALLGLLAGALFPCLFHPFQFTKFQHQFHSSYVIFQFYSY